MAKAGDQNVAASGIDVLPPCASASKTRFDHPPF